MISAVPKEKRSLFLKALQHRNASLVDINPTLTNLLGCNSAVYVLGTREQAVAVLYYLIKYRDHKEQCAIDSAH